jgi:hypothetical protein
MSRSRRKTPIGGHASESEKQDKRKANRKFRRREKNMIKKGNYDNLPVNMNEIINVWDMGKDGKAYFGYHKGDVYIGRGDHGDPEALERERQEDKDYMTKRMRK